MIERQFSGTLAMSSNSPVITNIKVDNYFSPGALIKNSNSTGTNLYEECSTPGDKCIGVALREVFKESDGSKRQALLTSGFAYTYADADQFDKVANFEIGKLLIKIDYDNDGNEVLSDVNTGRIVSI